MKGKLILGIGVLLVFGFLSCTKDKGLEKFQEILIGSWTSESDYLDFGSFKITKDKFVIYEDYSITYRFDRSKIYIDIEGDQYEFNYKILNKDSFSVGFPGMFFGRPIEIKILDKNTVSVTFSVLTESVMINFKRE